MHKVLLINPEQTYYERTYRSSRHGLIGLPVGLLSIASALEDKGCIVKVIDATVSDKAVLRRVTDGFSFGIPAAQLTSAVLEFNPDLIGISSQFTSQEEGAVRTAALIKKTSPSVPIIIGGANVSVRASALLDTNLFDIAVTGEGEKTIADIVDYYAGIRILADLQGIAYRDEKKVIQTQASARILDLDSIPFPAYHLVDMERYLTLYKKGIATRDRDVKRSVSMVTSRGCPHECIFCSIQNSMGRDWRPLSADYVIRHVRMLVKRYRVKHIHFEDDNLLLDLSRFLKILDIFDETGITWDTPNGIRASLEITDEILRRFKKSGCKSLTIGVESGDERVLGDVINKKLRLADVDEFAGRCRRSGIPLRAFFVLGFPGEDIKSMEKTIAYAMHLFDDYAVEPINLIATPLYGTRLLEICCKNNYLASDITPRALSESTTSNGFGLIRTREFEPCDVERLSRSFTSKIYRKLLFREGLRHPVRSFRRIGNPYLFSRILMKILSRRA